MDTALSFVFLLRCWCVCSLPRKHSVSFSVVFSGGTQLLVDVDEDDDRHHHNKIAGSGPSVQILTSVPPLGSPPLLVCVLTGSKSPLQEVMWWVNDTVVASTDVSQVASGGGGAYSATSVWEVPAAEWRSSSTYGCGTVQEGRLYRQKLCSLDGQ
ncbi:uncharacterized protein AB9W97_016320 isoform 2-T3 [Spinachia spinachia]